jgi:uncharacterized protein YqgC (DUF456 family)
MILAVILFVVGLIGTVLPVLPGTALIYAGMVLYGAMTGFSTLGARFYLVQGAALAVATLLDYLAAAAGTRLSGGSRQAAVGAVIGTFVALIVMGPLGLVVGPFAGAVGVELLRGVQPAAAVRVGFGTVVGTIGGTLLKLIIGAAMIAFFFMRVRG